MNTFNKYLSLLMYTYYSIEKKNILYDVYLICFLEILSVTRRHNLASESVHDLKTIQII